MTGSMQLTIFVIFTISVVALVLALVKKEKRDIFQWPLDYNSKSISFSNSNNENTYTWELYPGATSYFAEAITTSTTDPKLKLVYDQNFGTNTLEVASDVNQVVSNTQETYLRVTARTSEGNVTIQIAPCFLAGSLVLMADGSSKNIEKVVIGDFVRGAFGESNEILALHRPTLGEFKMCRINNEHTTTNHHPHVGADGGFFCGDPDVVIASTYNKSHPVITRDGIVSMHLHGLQPSRLRKMDIGSNLLTSSGSKPVETMEIFSMPPDTQLYNLVVGNSHTYFVEGYAVTGWPREDDFDYDTWKPKTAS